MPEPTNVQDQIRDEYEQWKSEAPALYDVLVTHNLVWPTLTCQWMPTRTRNDGFTSQELLIGSHTNDEEQNHVQFLAFDLPEIVDTADERRSNARMYITQRLAHDGEVNRARYQPSNQQVVATKTRDGDVLVFDRSSPESESNSDVCTPLIRLKGHTMEGYGLAWNPHSTRSNHLVSAGFDQIVCHWDIGAGGKELQPLQQYKGHSACVEDVSWNAVNDALFASVGDDGQLIIWDTRSPQRPSQSVQGHNGDINTVAFHPQKEWMLATGSSDKTIGLFDLRKLETKLHSIEHHQDNVTQVVWSPHDDPVLASAGEDRRIYIWDLRRIGEEQMPEDAEDGPPELMFAHGGHTSRITDLDWNPLERWVMASAAEDNTVHVWQMIRDVYASHDSIRVDTNDLE